MSTESNFFIKIRESKISNNTTILFDQRVFETADAVTIFFYFFGRSAKDKIKLEAKELLRSSVNRSFLHNESIFSGDFSMRFSIGSSSKFFSMALIFGEC